MRRVASKRVNLGQVNNNDNGWWDVREGKGWLIVLSGLFFVCGVVVGINIKEGK